MHEYKCSVCGAPIGGSAHTWLNEVRAVYINGHEWSAPNLSGVGLNMSRRDEVFVPKGTQDRYDYPDYNQRAAIRIAGMAPLYAGDDNVPNKDPNEPPAETLSWGYLFHDACWTLLQEACYPDNINIQTLMRILRSFPTQQGLVNWGHDYGGLFQLRDDPKELPKGAQNFLGNYRIPPGGSEGNPVSAYDVFNMDPLNIPWLERLLKHSVKERQTLETFPANNTDATAGTDCFANLMDDIRELLLLYLPSKDVLNLFFASKVMARTLLSQTFWESRFYRGNDFGYIFEPCQRQLVKSQNYYRDWKVLYLGLKKNDMCPTTLLSLLNRKRIWALLLPLAHVLILLGGLEPHGEPCATFWEPHLSKDNLQWQSLSGAIVESKRWLHAGCRTLFIRKAYLGSSGIIGVRIYKIQFYDLSYITGLKFYYNDGDTVELGYVIQGNGVFLNLDHDHNESGGKAICGFHAALGLRGLHALAIATDDVSISLEWAGKPEGFSHEAIILKNRAVRSIKAHFDGLNMIALSIPMESSSRHQAGYQNQL